MYGLREGLAIIAEEGLEKLIARHEQCAKRLHKGLVDIGLELFVPRTTDRLTTVTTVKVPDGVNWAEVVSYILKE